MSDIKIICNWDNCIRKLNCKKYRKTIEKTIKYIKWVESEVHTFDCVEYDPIEQQNLYSEVTIYERWDIF